MIFKLLLITTFCCLARSQLDRINVDADGHWFTDTYGRVVIFHGVNSVYKGFPWYHFDYLFNDTRLDQLEEWGLNIMRLGSMWAGAEPVEGEFNETYIDILDQIVDRLAERGVYTMLDMHQDVLSSYYNSYDGVPAWLVDYFPPPTNPYPWPLEEIEFWEQGYLTQACSESFQFIYNNTADAVYKWAGFWVKMAKTFKDKPAVLGYEYMNEPWIGDYFQDSTLSLPGIAGRNNIMPAYDIITEEVRKVDPNNGIVFYEPVIYGMLFDGNYTGSGFDRVPGGEQYKNLSAYSWHSYCWNLEFIGNNASNEEREQAREFCETELIPSMFESAQVNMNRTGGTGILSEYGICDWYEQEVELRCDTFVDLGDEYLHSWTEWDYSGRWYDGNGNPVWSKVLPHVRPYARRTAGIPQYMYLDKDTQAFTFEYEANLEIQAPTEIFVPAVRYPDGYQVVVSDGFDHQSEGNIVHILPAADNSGQTSVTVTITATPQK